MDILNRLDLPDNLVFLSEEIDELINSYALDTIISYEFRNKILMGRVWDTISKYPEISLTPQGKLYRYLTQYTVTDVPRDFNEYEVRKFWNIPDVKVDRLLFTLSIILSRPEGTSLEEQIEVTEENMSKLAPYLECDSLHKIYTKLKGDLQSLKLRLENKIKSENKLKYINDHKYRLDLYPPHTIVSMLLAINGYNGSIYQPKKLDYLLWLSTGLRLTDIIVDIHKYIKVNDEVKCTIQSQFLSSVESKYDSDTCGLSNKSIYDHYLAQCLSIGKSEGRLPSGYPGYSLKELRSESRVPKSTLPKKSLKSEYELLKFVDENIDKEFDPADALEYNWWFTKLGIKPNLQDGSDNYLGLTISDEFLPEINKRLNKYEPTEFTNIRNYLVGYIDDSLQLTKMSKDELLSFDNDLACDMILVLLNMTEITSSILLQDMKWGMLLGHLGVTLRKSGKGSYRIFLNNVNFNSLVELTYKSNKGYLVAKELLSKLSSNSKFYKNVLDNFNEAIWHLHICNCQCRLS